MIIEHFTSVSPLDTRFAVLDPQLRALAKKGALGIPDKPVEKPKAKPSPPKEVPKKKSSKDPSKEKEKPPKSLPEAIKQVTDHILVNIEKDTLTTFTTPLNR